MCVRERERERETHNKGERNRKGNGRFHPPSLEQQRTSKLKRGSYQQHFYRQSLIACNKRHKRNSRLSGCGLESRKREGVGAKPGDVKTGRKLRHPIFESFTRKFHFGREEWFQGLCQPLSSCYCLFITVHRKLLTHFIYFFSLFGDY